MYRLLGFNLDWLKVVIRMQVPQKIFILDAFVWEPHFYWSGVTCLVSSMQHEARWKITLLLAWIISRQGYLYYRHLNGNQRTVWDTCTSRLNVILIFPLYHFNSWRNSMFLYQISGGRRGGGSNPVAMTVVAGLPWPWIYPVVPQSCRSPPAGLRHQKTRSADAAKPRSEE